MDKVRTIRAAYICIGLAMLAVVWPELALWSWPVVPMFFFPSCVCCGTPCTLCSAFTEEYQVEITDTTCSSCASPANFFDGTWVLERTGTCGGSFTPCSWKDDTPMTCETSGALTCIQMAVTVPFNYTLSVFCTIFGFPGNYNVEIAYRNTYGSSPPDCSAWSAEDVAFLSNGTKCDGSSSTCVVTAL